MLNLALIRSDQMTSQWNQDERNETWLLYKVMKEKRILVASEFSNPSCTTHEQTHVTLDMAVR